MPEAEKVAQVWERRSWLSLRQSGGKWDMMKDGLTPVTSQRMEDSGEFRDNFNASCEIWLLKDMPRAMPHAVSAVGI